MTGKEKFEKYLKWCREKGLPAFLPEDNICFYCKKPIFKDGDVGPDWDKYPTGCPNCHHTFCD